MEEPAGNKHGRRAVVLGGGGVAGIAWECGLLQGLLEGGVDVSDADVVVGTSAGSVVGAALCQGGISGAYASQFAPPPAGSSSLATGSFDMAEFMNVLATATSGAPAPDVARARIGEYACRLPDQPPQEVREQLISASLRSLAWPPALRVTAVDATDGSFEVFTDSSGVALPRAILASCSVPGWAATVTIDGRRFMDGGVRSGTNADVAADCDLVLVIACNAEPESSVLGPTLPEVVASWRGRRRVSCVYADAESVAAYGPDPLDASSRVASARAGYNQGRRVATDVMAFWGMFGSRL